MDKLIKTWELAVVLCCTAAFFYLCFRGLSWVTGITATDVGGILHQFFKLDRFGF